MFSTYGRGHVFRNTSLQQTLEAKHTLKQELLKHNVTVKACLADNGRFVEGGFNAEVEKITTFFFVGAYGQNGMVERHIGKSALEFGS